MKNLVTVLVLSSLSLLAVAQQKQSMIEVTGESKLNIAPNQVVFSLTVVSSNASFSKCLDELNSKVARLKSALGKAGIPEKEIKTERYNVGKKTNYSAEGQKSVDHFAQHKLELKVELDPEKMKSVNTAIVISGVEVKMSLRFTISNIETYKTELLTMAVNDAKLKAEALAKAAGVELGDIKKISFGANESASVFARSAPMGLPMEGDGMDVNPSDLDLKEQVKIVFFIK